MKKIIYSLLITGFLASCGSDKKAELEKLKEKSSALLEQIKTLEAEIALEGDSSKTNNEKFKDVAVKTIQLESFKHYIDVQGKIEGDENVNVTAKMGGNISKILVNEGDEVRVGQTLAELDNSLLKQGIEELKTGLNFANDVFEKQKNLWNQKIGSEMQYLSAKNNKESLEKKLATMREQLQLSKIESPINGVVDAVDIKIGQAIAPGVPAIRVVNLNKLKAKADISETYASKVKKGNDVVVFMPDINKEVNSKIFYTSKVINPTTRTFSAEAELSEQNMDYRPNMIVILKVVDYQNDSSIVVPLNYIQHSSTGDFVYVAESKNGKNIAVKKIVVVGQIYKGKAEITSGLSPNEKLIISGHLDLSEGTIVKF